MKVCNKCKVEKPLAEFNKRTGRPCGVQSVCKECHKQQYAAWVKTPAGQEYERQRIASKEEKARKLAYSRTEEGKAAMRAYRQTEAGKAATRRSSAKILSTPEGSWKQYIRGCLNDAVRYGKTEKPSACSRCGKPGDVQGHHHSYAYEGRFDVIWLCAACHTAEHADEPVAAVAS